MAHASRLENHKRYLAGMGIAPWFGRYTLSGAAPSHRFQSLLSEAKDSSALPLADAPVISLKSVLATVESSIKPPQSDGEKAKLASHITVDAPDQPQALFGDDTSVAASGSRALDALLEESPLLAKEFFIRLYVCDDMLVVMDSANDASLTKERRLLENVLSATFSQKCDAEYLAQCVWPVFRLLDAGSASDASLRDNVLHRFFALATKQSYEKCFYFGRAFDSDKLSQLLATKGESKISLFPVSIFDCLNDASRKKELWDALRSNVR